MDVENIVQLFEGPCGMENRQEKNKVVEQKLQAGVPTITYQCKNGHRDVWHSHSQCLQIKNGQKLFVSSTLLAAATLLTGNNFEKINLFARCMKLEFHLIYNFSSHSDILCHPQASRHYGVK